MDNSQDTDQLRLLSIFHYVVAGLAALFSLFPLIHLAIGIAILSGAFDDVKDSDPPPEFMGWLFVVLPLIFIIFGLSMAACIAVAGRKISTRSSYLYCLIVAGVECCFMPFGTVLGVFTLVVLMRPSVKEMFGVLNQGDS